MFSVGLGLSDDAARELLEHALKNKSWRSRLEEELLAAFTDASTTWGELLCNDEYEVVEVDSDEEARQAAAEMLWTVAFPNRPLPALNGTRTSPDNP